MIEVIFFCGITVVLLYFSRTTLLVFRSHGFYRFFVWESLLALVLFNARSWFSNPVSLHQIISWSLLFLSVAVVIHGLTLLHFIGRPSNQREEKCLIGFEKTTLLVTVGIYKYIRHPMYASLFLVAMGAFFKQPFAWQSGALTVSAIVFLFFTARIEETECIEFFGPDYKEYMKKTKRFIPFIF
jgi:protein-S-isoprenylcysteine O-methyltransferase Ste14